jgi:hypothetical protein
VRYQGRSLIESLSSPDRLFYDVVLNIMAARRCAIAERAARQAAITV